MVTQGGGGGGNLAPLGHEKRNQIYRMFIKKKNLLISARTSTEGFKETPLSLVFSHATSNIHSHMTECTCDVFIARERFVGCLRTSC